VATTSTTSTIPAWPHENRWPLAALTHTEYSVGQTVLRLALAGVLFPHGAQHLLGLFGGYGYSGTLQWMTGTLGIPVPLAIAGILLEFFGPIALLLGVGGRFIGAALAVFMATAASTHLRNGFFMNWFGTLPAGAEGYEYHVLAIAMATAIALNGSGAFSIDRLLRPRS
jgi:putative oxidoreductase